GTSAPSGGKLGYFRQHQLVAVESLRRLWREPFSTTLAVLVMGIALALPLSLWLLLQNLQGLARDVDEAGTVSIYLQQGLVPERQQALLESLREREEVSEVSLITPEQALAEFERNSGFSNVLAGLDANPLPPVLVVTPRSLEADLLQSLQHYAASLDGVDAAEADLAWLERLRALVNLASRLALLLGLMLGLGVLLVIGNTIRLAIENRRTEIVVVKLVGGTDAYVARPFLYCGLWYGAGGGLVALGLSALSVALLSGPYARLMGTYGAEGALRGFDLAQGGYVLAGAALLGWLGAKLSVLRHLRSVEPR
ncbi:MAG: permease-like cell division protein FtsX, partial [Pseudomonadales bacterium]|nr:permease-like cell division protein FtsX [Pseudomonadales bacterium]